MNAPVFALTAVMLFETALSAQKKMMITGIAALVVLIVLWLLSSFTRDKHGVASKGAASHRK